MRYWDRCDRNFNTGLMFTATSVVHIWSICKVRSKLREILWLRWSVKALYFGLLKSRRNLRTSTTLYKMIILQEYILNGSEVWLGFPDLWSSQKALMELIFNPLVNFGEVRRAQLNQIHSPHLHVGAPGIFSDLLRSVQMLKGESGEESNRKLSHLFNLWWNCSIGSWVFGGRPAFDGTAA